LANRLVLAAQEGVRPSILREGSHFGAFSNSGAVKAVILAVLLADFGSLVGIVDLPELFLLAVLNLGLDDLSLAAEFIFFKFNQGLLLDYGEMLFLHLIDLLSKLLVLELDVLDVTSDDNFLAVDAILVLLVEISFLAKLFPGGFGVICYNFSLSKLNLHSFNFGLKARIFVLNVSN
jgi:hypothetical protein